MPTDNHPGNPDVTAQETHFENERPNRERLLHDLTDDLRGRVRTIIPNPTVKSRVKAFRSYTEKYLRYQRLREESGMNGPLTITDVLGLRVICPFLEDADAVVRALPEWYEVIEIEKKNEDRPFQFFAYASTHFLVRVPEGLATAYGIHDPSVAEIQVRTILQEAWAEVEHELVYKSSFTPFDEPLKRKLAALNANLTLSDIFFQEIRDYQRRLQTELKHRRNSFVNHYSGIREVQFRGQSSVPLPATPETASPPADDIPVNHASVDGLLLEALLAHNEGRYDRAIRCYSDILERVLPDAVRSIVLTHRGMAYFAESAFDRSMADFASALDADATNGKAWYGRGVVLSCLNNHQGALAAFDRCLALDPFQYDPLIARAQTRFLRGDIDGARDDSTRALKIDPDGPEARRLMALVDAAQGQAPAG